MNSRWPRLNVLVACKLLVHSYQFLNCLIIFLSLYLNSLIQILLASLTVIVYRCHQEAQDRHQRMKIMQLTREKQREQTKRLSQPNREPIAAASTKPKPRRQKRPRNKARNLIPTDGCRKRPYYSSSDEDENRYGEGVAADLASYKELLSSLEANMAGISAAGGEGDEDLATAVAFRRMQREGREGYGSENLTEDEEEQEEFESADDSEKHTDEERTESDPEANCIRDSEAEGNGNVVESGSDGAGDDVDHHQEIAGDEEDESGRGDDDFSRHFVATPVFPKEKAVEILSSSGRPSFKPLSGFDQNKWGALGLSAKVSRNAAKVPLPLPPGADLVRDLGVSPALAEGWDGCNGGSASMLQSLLLPPMAGYRDIMYCGWRDEDAGDIRRCYALHVLNHALTSRRRVVRHNARLRKEAEEAKVAEVISRKGGGKEASNGKSSDGSQQKEGVPAAEGSASKPSGLGSVVVGTVHTAETDSDKWQRDQGFTRPKVLILLPFRGVAYELLEIMVGLLGPKTVVINKDRFDDEYGPDDEDDTVGEEADKERVRAVLDRKPEDWKVLLGGGKNVDDMFTLGLSLSPGGGKGKPGEGKGVAVRLYCDFYNSDIILASPVALHRACVPGENGIDDGVDADFLSSIEVCVMDRADVFLMQNWAYVPDIADVLNTRPKGERAAKVDFSRVRPLFLHEQGKIFRQTLVFSAFQVRRFYALCQT